MWNLVVVVGLGGWHTVGCLRDQTPSYRTRVMRPVRVCVVGCGSPSGRSCRMVGVVLLVDWAGRWFVNSGREHLVAIREFNDIAQLHAATCGCVWCVVFLVFVLFLL